MTDAIRVLIVDDQEAFRSAARMVVESSDGFAIIGEAVSGEEGVRLAMDLAPDLILMDVKMPGIDGLEATRRIMAERPDARVVVLSTYDEFADQSEAAGAVAFIAKADFSPGRLVEVWSATS